MSEIVERRRSERDRLIALARAHVERLGQRRNVVAGVVTGSVARGDFNVWSDVDVLVVVDLLPDRAPDRLALVNDGAPSPVHTVGYTPGEFVEALRRRDKMAIDSVEHGVVVFGELASLRPR